MNERTAVGTVKCGWCGLEWIADDLDGHDDPQCLMFLFGDKGDVSPNE